MLNGAGKWGLGIVIGISINLRLPHFINTGLENINATG